MKFNEKLQELRKQKGITQEELAKALFVSRTAISKWESGRGYPGIDSLKTIACFFKVTVDDLLSSEALLTIAENQTQQNKKRLCDLLFGLLDFSAFLLLFLPLFADRTADPIIATSLLSLLNASNFVAMLSLALVIATVTMGIMLLALQFYDSPFWIKSKSMISIGLSILSVFWFIISLHPYAAIFSFVLLVIKALFLIKAV